MRHTGAASAASVAVTESETAIIVWFAGHNSSRFGVADTTGAVVSTIVNVPSCDVMS